VHSGPHHCSSVSRLRAASPVKEATHRVHASTYMWEG
jgi:hypothetical protein